MTQSIFKKLFSLKDKVVVITGSGGSLTGEMAKVISQCGAKVIILDIMEEAAQKRAEEINQIGCKAISLKCDVLNKNHLENCCKKIVDNFGKIDALINGAGGNKKEATTSKDLAFFDMSFESNKWVFELNFLGTLLPCQILGKEIAKQNTGSIINIASIAGFRPLTRAATYAAAKAAVINFTRWLAVYMCQNCSTKIRVNAIAPGFCSTEQNRYLLYTPSGDITERGHKILSEVPQNRFGEPCELTSAAVWLLSDSASFATGSVITIDGGFDAFSGV